MKGSIVPGAKNSGVRQHPTAVPITQAKLARVEPFYRRLNFF